MAHPRIDRPELLVDQAVLEKAVAGPAVALLDEDPDKAEFAGLAPDVEVEGFSAVELQGPLRKFTLGEFARRLDDVLLFFGQVEIHVSVSGLPLAVAS